MTSPLRSPGRLLAIIGGVREPWVVPRRACSKAVCARGTRMALLGGPSSPLGSLMRRLLAFWPLGLLPLVATLVLNLRFGSIIDLKITQAQRDLNGLDLALHAYRSKHGNFPSESEGLAALSGAEGSLVHIPRDPWGNPYLYHRRVGANSYLVYSPGLNHADDGGSGDDVVLAPKKYRCADYGVNCAPTVLQMGAWIAFALAGLSLAVGITARSSTLARGLRRPNNRGRRP